MRRLFFCLSFVLVITFLVGCDNTGTTINPYQNTKWDSLYTVHFDDDKDGIQENSQLWYIEYYFYESTVDLYVTYSDSTNTTLHMNESRHLDNSGTYTYTDSSLTVNLGTWPSWTYTVSGDKLVYHSEILSKVY